MHVKKMREKSYVVLIAKSFRKSYVLEVRSWNSVPRWNKVTRSLYYRVARSTRAINWYHRCCQTTSHRDFSEEALLFSSVLQFKFHFISRYYSGMEFSRAGRRRVYEHQARQMLLLKACKNIRGFRNLSLTQLGLSAAVPVYASLALIIPKIDELSPRNWTQQLYRNCNQLCP